ncbi:MAG: hypothetical protein Aurels2KO_27250 [Aureliella sp.]
MARAAKSIPLARPDAVTRDGESLGLRSPRVAFLTGDIVSFPRIQSIVFSPATLGFLRTCRE